MAMLHYPAIIERASEGFGVFFPDVPGCTSGGDTLQEAAVNAGEALNMHINGLVEDGDPLPTPSTLDTLEEDADVNEAARLLVGVDVPGRAQRLNISLEESLVARIDSAAAARGMSRSAFLAEGARRLLAGG